MIEKKLKREIRILLYVLVGGLAVSGITAFPIHSELVYAHSVISSFDLDNALTRWIETVYQGVDAQNSCELQASSCELIRVGANCHE